MIAETYATRRAVEGDPLDQYVRVIANRLWPEYRRFLSASLDGRPSENRDLLARRMTRAFLLAHLAGQGAAVTELESQGASIPKSGREFEPPVEAFSLPGGILTLPMDEAADQFTRSLNARFLEMLPDLPDAIRPALRFGDRYAWFITGVSSEQIVEELGRSIEQQLRLGMVSQGEFFEKSEEHLNFARSRLETVFRTTVGQAVSAGRWTQDQSPVLRSITPLYRYVAIEDARTRPHHLAFDGFIHDSGSSIWQTINPLNGFNCRCTREPIFEVEAEQSGLVSPVDGRLNHERIRRTWRRAIRAGLLSEAGQLTGREVVLTDGMGHKIRDTFPSDGFDNPVGLA